MAKKSVLNSVKKATPQAKRMQKQQRMHTASMKGMQKHMNGTQKDVVR